MGILCNYHINYPHMGGSFYTPEKFALLRNIIVTTENVCHLGNRTIKNCQRIESELIQFYCTYFSLKGEMQLNDSSSIQLWFFIVPKIIPIFLLEIELFEVISRF